MDRLRKLEKNRLRLVRDICDLASAMPDGHSGNAAAIAALYAALVDLLSEELRLTPELVLGTHLVDRIKGERELALTKAESWRGEAIAQADEEAGMAVPAS